MNYERTILELMDRVLCLEDRIHSLEQQLAATPAPAERAAFSAEPPGVLEYLMSVKHMQQASARARVSNCARVAQYEGDLARHYAADHGRELLRRLSYSREDQAAGAPPRHSIPMSGNIYTGTSTLRMAVGHYMDYMDYLHTQFS